MMKRRTKFLPSLSIYAKFALTLLLSFSLIFLADLALFYSINQTLTAIDDVYDSNRRLNVMSDTLSNLEQNLTDYLNTNSQEAKDSYAANYNSFSDEIDALPSLFETTGADLKTKSLAADVTAMSRSYLGACDLTYAAKEERNIQLYRQYYDESETILSYLQSSLYALNNRQLQSNSSNYALFSTTFHSLEVTSFLILALVGAAVVSLLLFLTHSITEPLQELSEAADEVSRGNFNLDPIPIRSADEVGVVTNAFNEMVISIRGYIQKLRESMEHEQKMKEETLLMDTHLKEAQLKYLQAQINPHFLFNTLNAAVQLAMMEKAPRTYKYLQNVAQFFRTKTNRENQVTTLRDEIALVDTYLYIINVRYAGAFSYEKFLDEDLNSVEMPSMILQPIVENAINHGLRDMEGGSGKITLSTYETGKSITISVRDNGKGMTLEELEKVRQGKVSPHQKGDETNGVGLANVVERLKLFYHCDSNDDVFDITSAGPGKGTEVLLYIPEDTEEEKGTVHVSDTDR